MLNYTEIYIVNGIGVGLAMILLLNRDRTLAKSRTDGSIYSKMVWWTLLLCAVEIISFAVDGRHFFGARVLNMLSNAFLMIGGTFFSHLWLSYLDRKIFPDSEDRKRREIIHTIPTALVVLLDVVNFFVPIYFYIDADNQYARMPLQSVIYVLVYGRLLLSLLNIAIYRKQSKNYTFFNIILFLIPIFIGSAVQFLNYGIALMWTCCAISMIVLKDSLQSELSYVDYLSGVYNRQFFSKYIEHETMNGPDYLMGGIIIDVDWFKEINDRYGHHMGDQAIRDIGYLLRKTILHVDIAARYGGDEFILLSKLSGREDIQVLKTQIQESVARFNREHGNPYTLSFSMGTGIFEKDDTVDSFLRRMDEELYVEKQYKHSQKNSQKNSGN